MSMRVVCGANTTEDYDGELIHIMSKNYTHAYSKHLFISFFIYVITSDNQWLDSKFIFL